MHALGIDWEDWHQLIWRRVEGYTGPATDAVLKHTENVLETLEQHGTRATFFVVGMVAERHPAAVRRIAAAGHEIAMHGYSHIPVKHLGVAAFREDTRRAKEIIEQVSGRTVRGYRAPELSIDAASFWVLDVLARLGVLYDSSIVPANSRYGTPGFRPHPAAYQLTDGRRIIEFPLTTARLLHTRVPAGGGSFFRLLPAKVIRDTIRDLEADGLPYITYFHPYEFVREPLRYDRPLTGKSARVRLAVWRYTAQYNFATARLQRQVGALLKHHKFTAFEDLIHGRDFPAGGTLL